MLHKNGVLLSFFVGSMFWTAAAFADEVAVIRAEDEDLLQGLVIGDEEERAQTVAQDYVPEYPTEERAVTESERKEWFDPSLLPTNRRKAEVSSVDVEKQQFRDVVNQCIENRKERMYMERGLFDNGMPESVAYLSQTMAEINECYEDVGREIINHFYNGDRTMMTAFNKKAQTFYISGTDVNFRPEFCDENCSMADVLDAQVQKFAEFRIYLYQLIDNGAGGR